MNTIMEHISGNECILCTVMSIISRHFMSNCHSVVVIFLNFVTSILVLIATRKMTVEVEGHQSHDRGHGALGKLSFDILSTISQFVLVFTTFLVFELADSE